MPFRLIIFVTNQFKVRWMTNKTRIDIMFPTKGNRNHMVSRNAIYVFDARARSWSRIPTVFFDYRPVEPIRKRWNAKLKSTWSSIFCSSFFKIWMEFAIWFGIKYSISFWTVISIGCRIRPYNRNFDVWNFDNFLRFIFGFATGPRLRLGFEWLLFHVAAHDEEQNLGLKWMSLHCGHSFRFLIQAVSCFFNCEITISCLVRIEQHLMWFGSCL